MQTLRQFCVILEIIGYLCLFALGTAMVVKVGVDLLSSFRHGELAPTGNHGALLFFAMALGFSVLMVALGRWRRKNTALR
jgi:hypothetical protein